ncbi:MAG: efflux RND transporter periplasmic adaptor subunit, partial [Nitrospirota bacterium]
MMKYGVILMLAISALFINYGCGKNEPVVKKEKTINVAVKPAEIKSLRPFIETVGTLNPYDEVTISAEVDGILQEISVDEGTTVTKGMLIATIDETDYSLEVIRAKAALKQAESNLANIRLEYQRKEALHKDGHLPQQDLDSITARLSLAESDVDNARAVLSLSEHKLTKTKIYSPLSGVVKERKVSGGNFIRNGTPV